MINNTLESGVLWKGINFSVNILLVTDLKLFWLLTGLSYKSDDSEICLTCLIIISVLIV